MVSTSESSSEDDDIYVSAVSRLKALKKKPVILNDDSPTPCVENELDFWSSPSTQPLSQSPITRCTRSSNRRARQTNPASRSDSPDIQIVLPQVVIDNEVAVVSNNAKNLLNIAQDSIPAVGDENYTVGVKVLWQSKEIIRLELKKYDTLQPIFQHFAEVAGVSENQILILKQNKPVQRLDTPASLHLGVLDILEGGIVSADVLPEVKTEDVENVCKIKVQMSTKQKINVDLKMDETFERVVTVCAEELGVDVSRIKLAFDGDDILLTDTPESLDLEQEACIDLHVVA